MVRLQQQSAARCSCWKQIALTCSMQTHTVSLLVLLLLLLEELLLLMLWPQQQEQRQGPWGPAATMVVAGR